MKKIVIITLIGILAISCGNNNEKKTDKETVAVTKSDVKSETVLEKKKAENLTDGVTILLSSNDQMQYDKKELKVKAGQKVTLTLKHTGEMAKNVMGHNFVLLKIGTEIPAFSEKAMTATDTDYIPKGNDNIIVHTKLIGGGESVTITFDAPTKGIYDYICSFPGHYALMKGKFIVE